LLFKRYAADIKGNKTAFLKLYQPEKVPLNLFSPLQNMGSYYLFLINFIFKKYHIYYSKF